MEKKWNIICLFTWGLQTAFFTFFLVTSTLAGPATWGLACPNLTMSAQGVRAEKRTRDNHTTHTWIIKCKHQSIMDFRVQLTFQRGPWNATSAHHFYSTPDHTRGLSRSALHALPPQGYFRSYDIWRHLIRNSNFNNWRWCADAWHRETPL